MTLKLDDSGCCRIHSISDDGNAWMDSYQQKVCGKNMTLTEAVDSILKKKESRLKSTKEKI